MKISNLLMSSVNTMDFNSLTTVEWIFIISTIAILPLILYSLFASIRVQLSFSKYSKIKVRSDMTAGQFAEQLLRENNCDVRVEKGHGHLSDHYDPRTQSVVLSPDVYDSNSIAAYGIAAHEVGHAIQDATNYTPLKIRQLVIKSTGLINKLLLPIIIIGMIAQIFVYYDSPIFLYIILAFVVMYGLSFLVSVITLPTEFNASNRAREMLRQSNLLEQSEQRGASKVLSAAAMTYVAAMAVSLVYFLRYLSYLLILMGRRK